MKAFLPEKITRIVGRISVSVIRRFSRELVDYAYG